MNAIIDVPSDFAARLHEGNAKMLLVLDGVETATAISVQTYVSTSIASWEARHMSGAASFGTVTVEPRMWYNNANSSTWFFIPGLVMLIMTIIGVMLTSVVMAREWERGTFESLFVTPVKPMELVLAKMVPYFFIALLGTGICLVLSRFLFSVPMVGSLSAILGISMIYLLVALGIGLMISAVTKNQFLACQLSLLISFLPCFILSGFIFDLRSTPIVVRAVGEILPFSHYLVCIRSLFLSGNNWTILLTQGGDFHPLCCMLREHRFWHHEKEGGMMSTFQLFLQQLAVICKKEILSIWQDPATRRIVVIPCILMGFLFGYAANYNLENAPYVVLDQSRSGASADLLSRFDGTSLFPPRGDRVECQ